MSGLESDWKRLFAATPSASVFQKWEWINAWVSAYHQKSIFLISCFHDGRLAGLLPLYIAAWPTAASAGFLRVLRLMGDTPDDAGALGAIVEQGFEAAFAGSVVDWLETNRSEWDALELNDMAQGPADTALLDELRRRRWAIRLRTTPRWVLDVSALKPESVTPRSARRAMNRLTSSKVEYQRAASSAELDVSLEHLFHLHSKRWGAKGKTGAFTIEGRRTFYRLVAASMLEAGALDLWTLKLDQQVVAAEFGLVRGETRCSLLSGFDPDFARYRVGALLDRHIIGSMRERGLSRLDFLGGDEKYKQSMGALSKQLIQLRCAPPGGIGATWVRGSSSTVLQRVWAAVKRI